MTGRRPIVRPAAVAGAFYPADPHELHLLVRRCIADAVLPEAQAPVPEALVVPHAGLVYSGAIAASAYLRVVPAAERVTRIVLLGPSHRVAFYDGIAATGADAFATPLGLVPVDGAATNRALGLRGVAVLEEAHAAEHCLEVQLPFLQTLLPQASIVPFVVGDASEDEVAALLELLWGDRETLVVISSDLSHYHRHEEAVALDRRTAAAILAARSDQLGGADRCGVRPLRGLLHEVRRRGLTVEQLDLRTSGDTAGDRDRVVGYGAFAVS